MSGQTVNDVIQGALKLVGKLDCQCFTSWQDFVKAIPSLFAVEVPASITNVVVSTLQPDDDQRDNLWFRLASSGSFMGLYIYAMGDWRQIFPTPQGIFRMFGNSLAVPAGYQIIDASNPNFTALEVAFIQSTWYLDPSGAYYTIFDCTYIGF